MVFMASPLRRDKVVTLQLVGGTTLITHDLVVPVPFASLTSRLRSFCEVIFLVVHTDILV